MKNQRLDGNSIVLHAFGRDLQSWLCRGYKKYKNAAPFYIYHSDFVIDCECLR